MSTTNDTMSTDAAVNPTEPMSNMFIDMSSGGRLYERLQSSGLHSRVKWKHQNTVTLYIV